MQLKESHSLTVLLGDAHKIYPYEGMWSNAAVQPVNIETIGNIIRDNQNRLGAEKNKLMLIIKPSASSTYQDLVNILDEAAINEVEKYAVVDLTKDELVAVR
jgi:hypothetical protein